MITGRYYREHCKIDKAGHYVKNMEVITKNLSKLIIIDDSEQVYNMYKGKSYILKSDHFFIDNTILVEAWMPSSGNGRKKDIWLNECIKIFN